MTCPPTLESEKVRYETRPAKTRTGEVAAGLHSVWITLDNEPQLNSYTTEMVKDVIVAFRRASNDRSAVAVVFTGAGTRAFCTGGNVAEYAEYYAGQPGEYAQYMRLFNDMVTSILTCDLPVICRVNGMRIAGGQEIGMACDLSIASDLATFGQAGPKHGSAPDGGSTDFLPLFVGVEHAMMSCTSCEPWSAYKALRLRLIHEAVPVLEVGGRFVPNPLVVTDRMVDEIGRFVFGEPARGRGARPARKAVLERGRIDLGPLDAAVETLVTKFLHTMPGCLSKTVAVGPQAQALPLGPEPRDEPRVARAQHDDRGAGGLPGVPRGRGPGPGGRLRQAAPGPRGRRALERGADRVGAPPARRGRGSSAMNALEVPTRPVIADLEAGDSLLRIVLNKPKGNILDFDDDRRPPGRDRPASSRRRLVTILFEGQGPNFSFGASVEEHRGSTVEMLLPAFHGLFRDLAGTGKVLLAAVRGNCLGGGLELAAFCHRVFASPDAKLGCPEIRLGVFAPAASCILPYRDRSGARRTTFCSRAASSTRTRRSTMGLVDEIADDPAAAALAWHAANLAPHSATALAHAVRAAQQPVPPRVPRALSTLLERQYLDELRFDARMPRGNHAFLEKRAPAMEAPLTRTAARRAPRRAARARRGPLPRPVVRRPSGTGRLARGGKAIGFLPIYAPREVIHAAGMLPVASPRRRRPRDRPRRRLASRATSATCRAAPSSSASHGALDCLDGMIFPSTCDVIRNLSGMWQIMFPGTYVHYFDMPQNFSEDARRARSTSTSSGRSVADLERLGGGERLGRPPAGARSPPSTRTGASSAEIDAMRIARALAGSGLRAVPPPPGRLRASGRGALRDAARLPRRGEIGAAGGRTDMARVAIRGCFCEQPPLDLLRTLERSGCFIVDDDCVLGAPLDQGRRRARRATRS